MTRRNLFQAVSAAVGVLFFPRTVAITPQSAAMVSADLAELPANAPVFVGEWEDLEGWYLTLARRLGEAAVQQRDLEILGIFNQSSEALVGHPICVTGWKYE